MPPKSVVKLVESTSTMSPARCSFGGIQSRQLNSVSPAALERVRTVKINGLACKHLYRLGVRGRHLYSGEGADGNSE